jgi:hypothetical protein
MNDSNNNQQLFINLATEPGNIMKTLFYILTILLPGQIFAQMKKAEDFSLGTCKTFYRIKRLVRNVNARLYL